MVKMGRWHSILNEMFLSARWDEMHRYDGMGCLVDIDHDDIGFYGKAVC